MTQRSRIVNPSIAGSRRCLFRQLLRQRLVARLQNHAAAEVNALDKILPLKRRERLNVLFIQVALVEQPYQFAERLESFFAQLARDDWRTIFLRGLRGVTAMALIVSGSKSVLLAVHAGEGHCNDEALNWTVTSSAGGQILGFRGGPEIWRITSVLMSKSSIAGRKNRCVTKGRT
jgi:hypothetical protein